MAGISRYRELRRARRRLIEATNSVIRQVRVIEENDPDFLWDVAEDLATALLDWGMAEQSRLALRLEDGGDEDERVGYLLALVAAAGVAGFGHQVLHWLYALEREHAADDLRRIVLELAQLGLTTGAVEECRSIIDRYHLDAIATLNGLAAPGSA